MTSRPRLRQISGLTVAVGLAVFGTTPPARADAAADLLNKVYQVETTADGAVNIGISADASGYGVVSPGRVIPEAAGLPSYRLETLADARGNTLVIAARLRQHLAAETEAWQVTGIAPAPKVSADSNLTWQCQGNQPGAPVLTFVYYDNERKGRPIRKIAATYRLDLRTGQLTAVGDRPPTCRATEDPL